MNLPFIQNSNTKSATEAQRVVRIIHMPTDRDTHESNLDKLHRFSIYEEMRQKSMKTLRIPSALCHVSLDNGDGNFYLYALRLKSKRSLPHDEKGDDAI
jgi:hypothetical protein